ncbi:MAG TPA: hypothetical protein VHC44_06845 [Verrucomicrobiae bacterium]|nr:hypothetical protein [Verrucomicrobiae bacterium]
MELVEFGHLSWAFDVARSFGRKRELRILPASLADFQAQRQSVIEWPQVCKLLVPNNDRFISGLEVQRLLNIGATHVANMIESAQLKAPVKARRGRNGSAQIETESFLNFLKKRAVL